MAKVTFQKVYHIFKSSPDQWEMGDVEDYFEFCADHLYSEVDMDVYEDNLNLKEEFVEKFGGQEGYVHYYAEFNIHGFVSQSMDGDEYDEEYEVITDSSTWLGGEEWNKELFEYGEKQDKLKERRLNLLIDKLNNLLSFTNSIMQANKNNYEDIVRYTLENYPVLLKNKLPGVYQSISTKVDLSSMANIDFWESIKDDDKSLDDESKGYW